jgi:hypothetical protein
MNKKTTRNKKGSNERAGFIAAYALVTAAVVTTLLTGLLVFVSVAQRQSSDEISRQQALQLAESGVYFYKWYLAHNLDGKNAQQIRNFWDSDTVYGALSSYEVEVKDNQGNAIGKYSLDVTVPSIDSTIATVESTGWTYAHPEIKRAVKVRFRRAAWSEFSVLANDAMRFGEGTVVQGPIHSNGGIRFDGVANNQVSSSVASYVDPDTGNIRPGVWTSQPDEDVVFLAGKKFPIPAVDFNGVTTDLALIKSEAIAEGLYFGGDTQTKTVCGWVKIGHPPKWQQQCNSVEFPIEGYHISLRADDKIEKRLVYTTGGSTFQITSESSAEVFDIPANGLIFVEDNVWVDGIINSARFTIASANLTSTVIETDIYINNDIRYTNTDGQDVLGLIAENNISVGLYSENDLRIDAALLAQKGRIGRDHYTSTTYRWRDAITVYGSLATNHRYGFSWTDETGYEDRNLIFDNNLLYTPPPFFPTGTSYDLDLWEDL